MSVADSEARQQAATGAWLDEELARGAKVYYKGWSEPLPERHWLAGPTGPRRGRDALALGQIELSDYPSVIERCGGTTAGLHRLQHDEIVRALDEGWPAVAMIQESPGRPVADEAEVAELAAQEAGYDALLERWPLRVLCQLTTPAENGAAIRASALVHHAGIADARWSARTAGGRWWVTGELDAHVVPRFDGALAGALHAAGEAPDGADPCVDLGGVSFLDIACARVLVLAAGSVPDGRRVVVRGASPLVGRMIDAIGRPASLVLPAEEEW